MTFIHGIKKWDFDKNVNKIQKGNTNYFQKKSHK